MSKFKNIVKELYIKEQEDIEPIGGPTVSPNEFAYFDFKSWAYDVGTKELFREKKFLVGEIEYTLEEATEMGAGIMFSVLTQIWTLWTEETGNDQFGRITDENVNDFGKSLYNMMKKDGKGFFFKGEEMGAKVGDDADYLKQTYGVEMNEEEVREIIKKSLREAAPAVAAAAGGGGAMSGFMAALGRSFAGIGGSAARAGGVAARGASRTATASRPAAGGSNAVKDFAKDYAKDYAQDKVIDFVTADEEEEDDGVDDPNFELDFDYN